MGQKQSTPPPRRVYHSSNYAAQGTRMAAPSQPAEARIRRENSYGEKSTFNNLNIQPTSNVRPIAAANSTTYGNWVSNGNTVFPSGRPAVVPNKAAALPASRVLITQVPLKSEPTVLLEKPVAVNNVPLKHEGTKASKLAGESSNLPKSSSPVPLQVNDYSNAGQTTALLPIHVSQDETKQLNINSLYPDLSAVESACSERNSIQETPGVCADSSDYKSAARKNDMKHVSDGVVTTSRRQRIRRKRKQQCVSGGKDLRPLITRADINAHDISSKVEASEVTTLDDCNFLKTTVDADRHNTQSEVLFNERTFLLHSSVVLKMLNSVNLEISSDATKIMLTKLQDTLMEVYGTKTNNAADEKCDAELYRQKLDPEDIFETLCSVDSRYAPIVSPVDADDGDDFSEEDNDDGSKSTVQHVFGDVYFCSACEQDLHGQVMAEIHDCKTGHGSAAPTEAVEDTRKQGGSDAAQTKAMEEVHRMWREVNKAQKGRWYNFEHLKDNTFQCTMCDVYLESTHEVIKHVRQKGHQQLLAQRRAEETAEERMWREVPKGMKFNKRHFLLVELGDADVFVCNACVCDVPFRFPSLMSHLLSKDHAQALRKLRRK